MTCFEQTLKVRYVGVAPCNSVLNIADAFILLNLQCSIIITDISILFIIYLIIVNNPGLPFIM